MIKYKPTWKTELRQWLAQSNQAFINQFDENAINRAIAGARNHFPDKWCKEFIDISMDPFDTREVTIEQGAHQPENTKGGGYKLHFTGRDQYGFAFHFYLKQILSGALEISEISYMDNGLKKFARR